MVWGYRTAAKLTQTTTGLGVLTAGLSVVGMAMGMVVTEALMKISELVAEIQAGKRATKEWQMGMTDFSFSVDAASRSYSAFNNELDRHQKVVLADLPWRESAHIKDEGPGGITDIDRTFELLKEAYPGREDDEIMQAAIAAHDPAHPDFDKLGDRWGDFEPPSTALGPNASPQAKQRYVLRSMKAAAVRGAERPTPFSEDIETVKGFGFGGFQFLDDATWPFRRDPWGTLGKVEQDAFKFAFSDVSRLERDFDIVWASVQGLNDAQKQIQPGANYQDHRIEWWKKAGAAATELQRIGSESHDLNTDPNERIDPSDRSKLIRYKAWADAYVRSYKIAEQELRVRDTEQEALHLELVPDLYTGGEIPEHLRQKPKLRGYAKGLSLIHI